MVGKGLRVWLALWAVAGLTLQGHASSSYNWSGAQAIPDGDATGVAFGFSLSGLGDQVIGIDVALSIAGGWNGDLYAYLSKGDGFAVLLNRPGLSSGSPLGYSDSGLNVTISSGGGSDIHFYQALSAPWAADGRLIDPASSGAVFDTAPRNHTLDVFNGMDPNGQWTFFIADGSGGHVSTLTGWSVTVQAVPEPGSLALLMSGAATMVALALRRRIRRKA